MQMKQKQEHDKLDYDGMGNYGRFPPTNTRNPERKTSDILIIVMAILIPVVYVLIK